MANIKYCPHCQQNVGVITKPTTAALILCMIGFPFLVGSNTLNRRNTANTSLVITSLVMFIALFKLLIAIGWIIAIIGLLFRRNFCPICRTPSSMLQLKR